MLEALFNETRETVFAICEYNGNLVVVPCDDEMSGIYPRYEESRIILKEVHNKFEVFNKIEDNSIDAIVFMRYGNKYEVYYAEDGYDGFQLLTD